MHHIWASEQPNCVHSTITWQRLIRWSMWLWCLERMVEGCYLFCFVPFSEDNHKHVNTCQREINRTARLPEIHYFASGYRAITELGQTPRLLNSKVGSLKWDTIYIASEKIASQTLLDKEVTLRAAIVTLGITLIHSSLSPESQSVTQV